MSPETTRVDSQGLTTSSVGSRIDIAQIALYTLCFLALYQFCHFHLEGLRSYLDLGQYLRGQERMPFQARVLPMYFLRLMQVLHVPAFNARHTLPAFSVVPLNYLLFLDLPSIVIAFTLAVKLHRKARPASPFSMLVFPIMFFATSWSYLIHVGYDLYYPYDMLSLAFFTAGLYCVYTRRFVPLFLIVLTGTLNRETTLFLIPLFVLDALAPVDLRQWRALPWRRVPWLKAAALAVTWAVVKTVCDRQFPNNSRIDDFIRVRTNLRFFAPQMWPQALSGCAYLLPVVLYFRNRVSDSRIAAYLLVIPLWFVVMVWYGVLVETRIYGELCPLVAIACVFLLEDGIESTKAKQNPVAASLSSISQP